MTQDGRLNILQAEVKELSSQGTAYNTMNHNSQSQAALCLGVNSEPYTIQHSFILMASVIQHARSYIKTNFYPADSLQSEYASGSGLAPHNLRNSFNLIYSELLSEEYPINTT